MKLKLDSIIIKSFLLIIIIFILIIFGTFHIINETEQDQQSASKYFFDKFSSVNLASNFRFSSNSSNINNSNEANNVPPNAFFKSLESYLRNPHEVHYSHQLTCPDGEEVVYWKQLTDEDFHYQMSFSYDNQEQELFLTYEPDHGGWNNIRMHMEIVIILAYTTGRTLVLPPDCPLYLLNSGTKDENLLGFEDFFPINEIKKKVKMITMEEYLTKQGLRGKLHKKNEGIFPKFKFIGDSGIPLYPPKDKVKFNLGIREEKLSLFEYLRNVSYCPKWSTLEQFVVIPKKKGELSQFYPQKTFKPAPSPDLEYHGDDENGIGPFNFEFFLSNSNSNSLRQNNDEEKKKLEGRGRYHRFKSDIESEITNEERQFSRIEKFASNRTAIYYDKQLQSEPHLHFITRFEENYRLFNHFYAFLFFEDLKLDRYIKRFARDYLHYNDEILCNAAKVVKLVLRDVKKYTSNGKFTAFHIRRGEFQYKIVKISSGQMLQNLENDLPKDHEFVYIATDERNKTFFNEFKEKYPYVRFLDDYFEEAGLADVNPNLFGMIDQLVCVKANFFVGSWFSTFTGYITRMRGYYGWPDNTVRFGDKEHKDRFLHYEYPKFPFYMREFVDAWAAIDDEN